MPKCRPLQLNTTCGCPICPYHGTALIVEFEMITWPFRELTFVLSEVEKMMFYESIALSETCDKYLNRCSA